jgi:hypothetical protein
VVQRVGLLLALLAFAVPGFGCSCAGNSTYSSPCSALTGSDPVFVGLVLKDSGEGKGTGPARVRVEEGLANTPESLREVDIDTGAGSSCYHRLQAGERYVIFPQTQPRNNPWRIGGCGPTFPVRGNEHLLDALRNAARKGPSRLVGKVLRMRNQYETAEGIAGATVTAQSPLGQYSTATDASGRFEISGLPSGFYRLEVSKPGFESADEFNLRQRSGTHMIYNQLTKRAEPNPEDKPGTVHISSRSCTDRNLALWPDRSVSGRVFDPQGIPLSGVTVQAFPFKEGERPTPSPLRVTKTDANGNYALRPLPDGEYLIGVNIAPFDDSDAHPPTQVPSPVRIAEALPVKNIDLHLPPKRTGTTLHLHITGPDGAPRPGVFVQLANPAGRTRFTAAEKTPSSGLLTVPVYLGETYIVKAFYFPNDKGDFDYLGASIPITVTTPNPAIRAVLTPQHFLRNR